MLFIFSYSTMPFNTQTHTAPSPNPPTLCVIPCCMRRNTPLLGPEALLELFPEVLSLLPSLASGLIKNSTVKIHLSMHPLSPNKTEVGFRVYHEAFLLLGKVTGCYGMYCSGQN